jgi:hypothetical protein
MKTKKNILFLIENGLSSRTISSMSNKQVGLLVEKFKKLKKKETKEAVTQKTTTSYDIPNADLEKGTTIPEVPGKKMVIQKTNTGIKATPTEGEIREDEEDSVTSQNVFSKDVSQEYTDQEAPHDETSMQDDGMGDDSGENRSMMGMAESEINEKFESKAQQGLFWARCNKCSDKKCKWCKMAKEFSDSTSKKDYKKMPEKIHPEKTVKYKKKKTNENLQKFLEDRIVNIIENNIEPKMTKKDLINTIKKKSKKSDSMIIRRPKKLTMFSHEAPMELPIGKMFSIGKK